MWVVNHTLQANCLWPCVVCFGCCIQDKHDHRLCYFQPALELSKEWYVDVMEMAQNHLGAPKMRLDWVEFVR